MKNFKLLTKTVIVGYILLAVVISCQSNEPKISKSGMVGIGNTGFVSNYYTIIIQDTLGNSISLKSDSTMKTYYDKEHIIVKGDTVSALLVALKLLVESSNNNR